MSAPSSASDCGVVSRDRVTQFVRHILHAAVHVEKRFTVVELSRLSKIKERKIRSYMANDPGELREPSLSAALSLASVVGEDAVNAILSLILYGGARFLGEQAEAESAPMQLVADIMAGVNAITQAAADNEFDGKERDELRPIVDSMIARLVPLSSAGGA
ncbi:MAG: hypothetical protein ABGX08_17335 [Citromicrobium sp.]